MQATDGALDTTGRGLRVAVLQSSYIPWKGHFDLAHDVDLFVFYDDVQFTKNDWRNRNQIKTPAGVRWLTIPVGQRIDRRICDVELPRESWQRDHWRRLSESYRHTPFFADYRPYFEETYLGKRWETLSELNQSLFVTIARDFLGIRTRFADSRELDLIGRKETRLLDLLGKLGATAYVSGPAARSYIQPERFAEAGIHLEWKSYTGYPEYPQAHPPFEHAVTVLDLLFNTGVAAPDYVWGWRRAAALEATTAAGRLPSSR